MALATLDVFDEEQTLERLGPKIERLAEHLARIAALAHVGDVRQCGLIGAVELVRDRRDEEALSPGKSSAAWRVCDWARGQGVLLRPLGNVIVIMPPLAIALDELDRIVLAVEAGIRATTEE